jgi:hypothetical protein
VSVILVTDNENRRGDVERAWRHFMSTIVPCPLDSTEIKVVVASLTIAPGATAAAALTPGFSHPEMSSIIEPQARFEFSEGFFQRSDQEQADILLHEAVHIRFLRGRLRENYRAMRDSERHPDVDLCIDVRTPGFDFMQHRRNLAVEVLSFCQEVAVDKFIQKHYPDAFSRSLDERSRWYLGERDAFDHTALPDQLRPFLKFYRLLRAELGLLVAPVGDLRERLNAARLHDEGDLRGSVLSQDFEWFTAFKQRVLTFRIDTDEGDPDPYDELFARILAEPVPLNEQERTYDQ